MGIYENIFLYTEYDLDAAFCEYFRDKLRSGRGFGYWVWKPQTILQALKNINNGDLLQYTDSGCHLNPKGIQRLNKYFELANESKTGLLAFEMPVYTEKQYTKGDLFDYFDTRNNTGIYPCQIAANFLFIRKCENSVELIQKWVKVYYDDFALADDTPSVSPNFPEFIENRYDQSILSLLVKLNDVPRLLFMEGPDEDLPIWVLRDKAEKLTTASMVIRLKIKVVLIRNILIKAAKKILPESLYNKLKKLKKKLMSVYGGIN